MQILSTFRQSPYFIGASADKHVKSTIGLFVVQLQYDVALVKKLITWINETITRPIPFKDGSNRLH